MTTSLVPSEPFNIDAEIISDGTFAYFCSRNRMQAFSVVNQEFERSGITKAELAKRMGKGQDRVCRLLGAPGNWTLDTVSELLLAISGAQLVYSIAYPCRPKTITINGDSEPISIEIPDSKQTSEKYFIKLDDDGNPLVEFLHIN
jgi:hypothetical protein